MDGKSQNREKMARLATLLRGARRAVALTGAGVSTAAGIPDFRGPQGLYASGKYPPDKVFAIDCFVRHPELFYDFTREFLAVAQTLHPTFTHRFLAAQERAGRLRGVITQNVDMLHSRAGMQAVLEVHGSYRTSRCLTCAAAFDFAGLARLMAAARVPRCPQCGGLVKPDVVFFGEAVRELDTAAQWSREADLFLVIGSSLTVYPAAGLPSLTRGELVVINRGGVSGLARPALQFDAASDAILQAVADVLAVETPDSADGDGR
ncbi:MAG TPA: Sir2 family NAD-dependent protein deacetylase [bacterium]|nr:Sir2 family NAD-dependent protein deacetylase [bacterium]